MKFAAVLPRGSVLVFSLIVLSLMLVTALTILSAAVLDRKSSFSTGSSTKSFQVADSAVEEILYAAYKEDHSDLNALAASLSSGKCSNGAVSFETAGGSASVSFFEAGAGSGTTVLFTECGATDWRDRVVKIQSSGTSGATTRAVEVAVAASGGGVTGGCSLAMAWSGNVVYSRWGQGCKSSVTSPDVYKPCSDAADTGYSCGQTSGSSSGIEAAFCVCVKS